MMDVLVIHAKKMNVKFSQCVNLANYLKWFKYIDHEVDEVMVFFRGFIRQTVN